MVGGDGGGECVSLEGTLGNFWKERSLELWIVEGEFEGEENIEVRTVGRLASINPSLPITSYRRTYQTPIFFNPPTRASINNTPSSDAGERPIRLLLHRFAEPPPRLAMATLS